MPFCFLLQMNTLESARRLVIEVGKLAVHAFLFFVTDESALKKDIAFYNYVISNLLQPPK